MLVVHPLAREEMARAIDYYAAISEELATQIADEIDALLEEVESAPLRWSYYEPLIHHQRWRRRIAAGFPYLLIYEVAADHIRIVAFPHVAMQPGYWADR
ncbi:Plasmid stabilization system protein [Pseudobythopirellula maris]|uniref:Plasmid stabilization system protein n=1 Tax=Pseudobythopirellula maris TaxID=2527991 RepID=A0A5C5ZR31_9BACT|nr:type II toxin-antitoxin system RelE/ParE family toxin [Pseudobythopirellula maris]TWT89949.1 Plasmid stabilization system protein [Pseudobythopirellula maris]